jgi:benzodiazapine receptor
MPLFFGLQRPIEATVDIVALLGTTSYLTYVWSGIDNVATYIMFPYLGWLCFATYLSVSGQTTYLRCKPANLDLQAGCGYLNDWDFSKGKANQPKQN